MSVKGFKLSDGTVVKYDYSSLDNIITDSTLSVDGVAADAGAVGDELLSLQNKSFDLDELDRLKLTGLSGTAGQTTDRITQLTNTIGAEANTRASADTNLSNAISAETSARAAADAGLASDIAVERARITNLASLASGSTTGDAELADIRVGDDGVTYSSAGDAVRGQVADIKQELQEIIDGGGGSGMTEEFKQALHNILQQLVYISADGQTYLDALDNALWPPTNLTSISCVYTQSGTVYDTDSLNSLKSDLVVTATYDDSTSEVVTNYILSGTLTEGTSTITVSYGGKTDTFTVTVTHNTLPLSLYDWDFTESLVDSVNGVTAVLTGCTRDSSGVNFTAANQAIKLGSDKITITDKTYIIDIPSMTLTDGGINHARLLFSDTADVQTDTGAAGFVYRHNNGWTVYTGSTWGTSFNKTTYPIAFFNNKRLKIYIGTDLKLKVSYANIGSDEFTNIGTISQALESTYEEGYLVIGGNRNNNLSPVTISAIKIYEGEV